MTKEQVFKETGETYLCLIHPVSPDQDYHSFLSSFRQLPTEVPPQVVSALIVGESWRERLLGLWLAMAQAPESFVDLMLKSLADIRGYSITPTCAALAVLARRGRFEIGRLRSDEIDRAAFDGDLGWALNHAENYAAGEAVSTDARCPNSGQSFSHQLEMYEWIIEGQPGACT